jgi:hypothetical protein
VQLETVSLLVILAVNAGSLAYLLASRRRDCPPPPWRRAELVVAGRTPCPAGCCWLALAPAGGPSLPPTSIYRRREETFA